MISPVFSDDKIFLNMFQVITVDLNKSCDTAPKGLRKWLILSIKLNTLELISCTKMYQPVCFLILIRVVFSVFALWY
ncbi:hypothetical protein Hanom_Chr10g00933851 [Helianthus anomalus]